MGVQSLLPLLKSVSKQCSIKDFKGKRVAIDGFVWLHRSSYRCAKEMCENPATESFIPDVMSRIMHIVNCGLTPIVVFDGQQLPQKLGTNVKRRQERAEAKERAQQFESQGITDQATKFYQKAINITSDIVYTWIQHLKKQRIEYIVAPYEADAELAFLCRSKYVDCVMTEDSDLLAYQTPHILFKYDDYNLTVTSIKFADVLTLLELNVEQFITVCCLSGCDYMDHINRLGIQTALKLIKVHKDPITLLTEIRKGEKFEIPEDYETQLKNAMLTFKAQRIYDPRSKEMKTLEPIEEDAPDFLGAEMEHEELMELVTGKIDAKTHEKIERTTGADLASASDSQNTTKTDARNTGSGSSQKSKSSYFNSYSSSKSKKPKPSFSSKPISSYFTLSKPV